MPSHSKRITPPLLLLPQRVLTAGSHKLTRTKFCLDQKKGESSAFTLNPRSRTHTAHTFIHLHLSSKWVRLVSISSTLAIFDWLIICHGLFCHIQMHKVHGLRLQFRATWVSLRWLERTTKHDVFSKEGKWQVAWRMWSRGESPCDFCLKCQQPFPKPSQLAFLFWHFI